MPPECRRASLRFGANAWLTARTTQLQTRPLREPGFHPLRNHNPICAWRSTKQAIPFQAQYLWKFCPLELFGRGKIQGICAGNTSSTNFSISGIGSDNSSGVSNRASGKTTVQGELSLTRYKNYLVARLYNYSISGPGDITLPYSEVLEIKPLKHAVSKK